MGVASEAATAVAENAVTAKRPRVKILMKKPVIGACEVPKTPEVICCLKKAPSPLTGGRNSADTDEKKLTSTVGTKHVMGACQMSRKVHKVNNSSVKSSVTHSQITASCNGKPKSITGCKRSSEEVSDSRDRKRLKMDRSTTLICQQILKKLMDHKRSPPFHIPVDIVLYGIPDYFDIIKKPMDLGTVKHRLKENEYVDAEQFRADVKLTFSNAMLYNPPGNWVHEAAKELDRVFDRLWKPIGIKFVGEHRDAKQKDSESSNNKITYDKCLQSISAHRDQFLGKVLPQKEEGSEDLKMGSSEEQHSDCKAMNLSLDSVSNRRDQFPVKLLPPKMKGSKDLKMGSVEKQHSDHKAMNVSLKSVSDCHDQFPGIVVPQKMEGSGDLKMGSIEEQHSNRKAMNVSLESVSDRRDQFPGKVLPQKMKGSEDLLSIKGQHNGPKAINRSLESVSSCRGQVLPQKEKGVEDLNTRPVKAMKKIETKPQPKSRDFLSSKSDSKFSGSVFQSVCSMPAEVNCENPPRKKVACDYFDAAKVKSTKTLVKGSHDQGSEEKNHGFASFPAGSLGATVKGLESVLDVELSPSRALRVAKMRDRFAGLIVKAQHHKLLEPGGGTDTAAWQHEKELLQTRQHEEKAKIEAEIRAVQSAARLKTESERKKQRQAEREAARIALQKVEQSVFVDNNLEVLKDLEALIGSSLVVMCHDRRSHPDNICGQMMSDKLKSPLERLGLYIKEEYRVGDESDYVFTEDRDLEEGEVV